MRDNKTIKIITTNETDTRLLNSMYYLERKENWFRCSHTLFEKLDEEPIQMTELENNMIAKIIEKLGNDIVDHGWFDIATMY
jgi:hypothetical protein